MYENFRRVRKRNPMLQAHCTGPPPSLVQPLRDSCDVTQKLFV